MKNITSSIEKEEVEVVEMVAVVVLTNDTPSKGVCVSGLLSKHCIC